MFFEMTFVSKELGKNTQVNIIIPNSIYESDEPYKTLWLFHGLGDVYTSWMRHTAIERYASKYGLAVVMPDVDKSWYANTAYGTNYFNYVTKELPVLCRRIFRNMSDKREDNIVAGNSMGGYGALKAALTYPMQYGACISLSGSLDITRKNRHCELEKWRSLFGFDLESPLELEGSENDLFALVKKNKEDNIDFPNIYLWCGNEDPLFEVNRRFEEHLKSLGIPFRMDYSAGGHTWSCWDEHIVGALNIVLNN